MLELQPLNKKATQWCTVPVKVLIITKSIGIKMIVKNEANHKNNIN